MLNLSEFIYFRTPGPIPLLAASLSLGDFICPSTVVRIRNWVCNEMILYHLNVLVEEEYPVLETICINTLDIKREAGWVT
jgi:hypothetical protein